jgi:hypothetical protein
MFELTLPIRQRGALIKILVRVPSSDFREPPSIRGPYSAYLDTGASDSVIDPGVIAVANMEPIQIVSLNVLGRDGESYHETFAVELAVVAPQTHPFWVPLNALAGPIHPRGTVAALGRDFLKYFHLNYDGPEDKFTLSCFGDQT